MRIPAFLLIIATLLFTGCFGRSREESPLPPPPKSVDEYLQGDLPLPDHFAMLHFQEKQDAQFLVTLEGTDVPDRIIQRYRLALEQNGWTIYGITEAFDQSITLNARKADRFVEVIVRMDERKGTTIFTLRSGAQL